MFSNLNSNLLLKNMNNLLYKSRVAGVCGLLCLFMLLKVWATVTAADVVSENHAFARLNQGNYLSFPITQEIAQHRVPGLLFDFESAPEYDPEPTGGNYNAVKGITHRTTLPFCLLSTVESSRTRSTLFRCRASFLGRIMPPLFMLHNSWKHFLS